MIRLPGLCIVCREPVVWNGKRWRDPGRGSGRQHRHVEDRPLCSTWMPLARERCARPPGHVAGAHRTAYALANARAEVVKRWTRTRSEPHFVDLMTRKNLDNGAVKTTITEVQR